MPAGRRPERCRAASRRRGHGPIVSTRLGCPACLHNVWWLSSASGVVPADTPILRADDLGAAARRRHLRDHARARRASRGCSRSTSTGWSRSAARMDLALPDRARAGRAASGQALAAWPAGDGGRAAAGLHPRAGGRRRPGHGLRHRRRRSRTATGAARRDGRRGGHRLAGAAGRPAGRARRGCSAGPRPSRTR